MAVWDGIDQIHVPYSKTQQTDVSNKDANIFIIVKDHKILFVAINLDNPRPTCKKVNLFRTKTNRQGLILIIMLGHTVLLKQ